MRISDWSSDVCSSDLVGDGAFEIGFHRVVVLFDGELDELFAIFGGLVGEVGGDFLIEEFGAKAFVLPDARTLVDEVDEALEVAFGADGQIEDRRGRAEDRKSTRLNSSH